MTARISGIKRSKGSTRRSSRRRPSFRPRHSTRHHHNRETASRRRSRSRPSRRHLSSRSFRHSNRHHRDRGTTSRRQSASRSPPSTHRDHGSSSHRRDPRAFSRHSHRSKEHASKKRARRSSRKEPRGSTNRQSTLVEKPPKRSYRTRRHSATKRPRETSKEAPQQQCLSLSSSTSNPSRRLPNDDCERCGIDQESRKKYWRASRMDTARSGLAILQILLEFYLLCHLVYWLWLSYQWNDMQRARSFLLVESVFGIILFVITAMMLTFPYTVYYIFSVILHLGLCTGSMFGAAFEFYMHGFCNELTISQCANTAFFPWTALNAQAVKIRQSGLFFYQVINILQGFFAIVVGLIGLYVYLNSLTRLCKSREGATLIERMKAHLREGRVCNNVRPVKSNTRSLERGARRTNGTTKTLIQATNQQVVVEQVENEVNESPHRRMTRTAVSNNVPHQWVKTVSRYSEVGPNDDKWTRVCMGNETNDRICSLCPRRLGQDKATGGNKGNVPTSALTLESKQNTNKTASTNVPQLPQIKTTEMTTGDASNSRAVLKTVAVCLPVDNHNITKMTPHVSPMKYLEHLEANGCLLDKPSQYAYTKDEKK
ncbi:unnamed protein product, partial [Mesorhabditis belari]|uniref:Uncharacterized protein n=1 Tax=Mesorhabditis belari TaxID=2138241 RepID=A0AAF3F1S3_9BILA